MNATLPAVVITYEFNDLSAPFSYIKRFEVKQHQEQLEVKYSLTYTDREGMYKEDIEAEGFTGNDDESWRGTVHHHWALALQEMLCLPSKGTEGDVLSMNQVILELDGIEVTQLPGTIAQWEYFIHEFTQALYETGGAEYPLQIRFSLQSSTDTVAKVFQLNLSFAERTCTLLSGNEGNQSKDWKTTRYFLENYFKQEFVDGQWTKKVPNRPGFYTDPGDGNWYSWEDTTAHLAQKYKQKMYEEIVKFISSSTSVAEPKGKS
ncbi:MAG: hypothetical protein MUE33_11630 [Cytophagaceae bacterium]|jgi:hypothetical protein|nr:hypothetical protein [Cytophagaceae bacterium]